MRISLAVAPLKHTLLSWEQYFTSMGVGIGTTTPTLFRCGRRGREPHGGSEEKTPHVTAFLESADPRSGGRDWRRTSDTPSSRHRIDTGGSGFFSSRPLSAFAGRGGRRDCSPDRSSGKAMLRNGLSYWARTDVDARSHKDLARRAAERRCGDIESILPATCERPFERKNRCSFSSAGKRGARVGVPCSRQGALGGSLAKGPPSPRAQGHQSGGSPGRDVPEFVGPGSHTPLCPPPLPDPLRTHFS